MGGRMIDENVAKLIYNIIPSSLTVHGTTQSIQKTLGEVPLNEISCPTINVSFIDGYPLTRSFDDGYQQIDENTYTETDTRSAIIRYKVGATNITNNTIQTITVVQGQTSYTLYDPVLKINSITNHQNTDYQLSINRDAVEWLVDNSSESTFIIDYDWVDASYWVAHNVMDYIVKNILGNFRLLLTPFGVDITNVAQVLDISKIFSNQSLTVLTVDVKITYPFTWTINLDPTSDSMITLNEILLYLRRTEEQTSDQVIQIKGE